MDCAFVQDLAGMVPSEHLTFFNPDTTRPDAYCSPLRGAFTLNEQHGLQIVQMLMLRGVPLEVGDFKVVEQCDDSPWPDGIAYIQHYMERLRTLLAWAEAELHTTELHTAVVLGCGVHAGRDLPPPQRSQLMKLRGDGNTDARQRIARCLGVRVGAELRRLRAAAVVWREAVRKGPEAELQYPNDPTEDQLRVVWGDELPGYLLA